MEMVFVFTEILFKILLFKGGVLIYAEHCKCPLDVNLQQLFYEYYFRHTNLSYTGFHLLYSKEVCIFGYKV